MLTSDHLKVLELPRVYLVRMAVFTILICIAGAVLYPNVQVAFMANPGLNGMILLVLLLGIAYTFRMVFRLWPEVNWVNSYRVADPGLEIPYKPTLLAPMAAQLRDRSGLTILSPITLRSLLDSLASRLDEARDISRYMIGLLIFLGLLGTFWGYCKRWRLWATRSATSTFPPASQARCLKSSRRGLKHRWLAWARRSRRRCLALPDRCPGVPGVAGKPGAEPLL
jgi:hypothetical protein